jgi:hypothetical protein
MAYTLMMLLLMMITCYKDTMGEPYSTGEINGKRRIDIHACVHGA